jgi:uncharacterized protein with ParB-like and HNH nuclease domain
MKATETRLLTLLNKTAQFAIPLYQRNYAWEKRQCNQLWVDVMRAGANTGIESHFIGAVVYVHEGTFSASTVPRLLVIDGQQRLTTVTLLIKALSEAAAERPEEIDSTRELFRDYYLFNPHQRGDLRFKLLLTRRDRNTLCSVLDDTPPPGDEPSKRILENYGFFVDRISRTPLEQVVAGINKLLIVDVSLQVGHDNPQLIFESLNSTGLDLSQADLVRNWVLMGQPIDVQDRLFNSYWYPMEQLFAKDPTVAFDAFLRDFLTFETRLIPRQDSVYEAFKTWVVSRGDDMESVARLLFTNAQLYARMRLGLEQNPRLRRHFEDIKALEVDPVYPFLLGVFRDHAEGRLDDDGLVAVLTIVETYVFRRSVCDLLTNSLNRTFATLYGLLDRQDLVQSLAEYLFRIGGIRVFPSDADFTEALCTRDVYRFRLNRFLFRKLENFGRKEPIEIRNYSIEHIMPQNADLSNHWRDDLGEEWESVHQSRLHRLGNLTLTGYNSELSDRPFSDKLHMPGGFATSPLWLSRSISAVQRWDRDAIDDRGRVLAARAVEIWPFLPLPEEIREQIRRYGQGDSDAATGNAAARHPLAISFLHRALSAHDQLHVEERSKVKHLRLGGPTGRPVGSVIPWGSGMTLTLDVAWDDLTDPLGWCQAHTKRGRWGVGQSSLALRSPAHIEYGLDRLGEALSLIAERAAQEAPNGAPARRPLSQRHHARFAFWTDLLARAKERTDLHASISPSHENWIGTGTGVRGLTLNYVANMDRGRVELYIDRGKGADDENNAIFDRLYASREQIEEAFKGRLEWQRLDQRRACRICSTIANGGRDTVDGRDELLSDLVDRMVRLERALRPHIATLRL